MATVAERQSGGRPRTREPSALFLRIQGMAKRRGMKLDELADRAGLCVATLYNIGDPKVSTAKAIAAVLGVTVDRLVEEPKRGHRRHA